MQRYETIAAEIRNDPAGRGYGARHPWVVAAMLNEQLPTGQTRIIDPDWYGLLTSLSPAQAEAAVRLLITRGVLPASVATPTTEPITLSRQEALGLGEIHQGEVEAARLLP